jgi:sugar porter (SP) family MFS transporter
MADTRFIVRTALIVALGGFLMGFDASVISGAVSFIKAEFALTPFELGWAVASLTLTASLAMMCSGPLSDRLGRRPVLRLAAVLFAVSALMSALAPNFATLVISRLIGGLGVGAALIIAPMYIAEIAPATLRGRLVSFNQLNIVVGISAAFFSNYLILRLGHTTSGWVQTLELAPWSWRWMLGIEALPALIYFLALLSVPESPRWLAMRGRDSEARALLTRACGAQQAAVELAALQQSLAGDARRERASISELWQPALRLVLTIGIVVAIAQQITGINAVFFYAPMIFEQSGIGADAAFMQAALVGLVNLVFTVLAIALIDRLGRRPLLAAGMTGIAVCMFTLAYGFGTMRHMLVLLGMLGFVASFAISLGPVMWVLFSELFPNRIRGTAISFVGLINSAVSFGVQLVFPWQLDKLGSSGTFLLYGLFAVVGLLLVMKLLPETKGRGLEELERALVKR